MRSSPATEVSLLIHSGVVHTLDESSSVVQAVAVSEGRIAAVGRTADLASLVGPGTRVIDLGGRAVIPGLFDAHPHLDRLGLRDRVGVSIAHCRSVADIVQTLAEVASRTPAGQWIVTQPMGTPPDGYWSRPDQVTEGRFPDRHDLDRAAPDHPVFIRSPWGWWSRLPLVAVANSRALALCGVRADTPNPYRIEIVRDTRGDPNGVFLERNRAPTLEMVLMRAVPRFSFEQRLEGLHHGLRLAREAGITAAFEGHGLTPALFDAWRQLASDGALTMRMQACLSLPSASFDDDALEGQMQSWAARLAGRGRTQGLFTEEGLCLDVADPMVARILGCAYPYEHWAGHFAQALSSERLIRLGTRAAQLGLRVSVLVCYELERVLQCFEAIDAVIPLRELRWVAVHVTQATESQLARMQRLGLIATVTPGFMQQADDRFNLRALGAHGTPIRALLDAGVPVALSTDGVPHSMLFALWQSRARRDGESGLQLGESRLTRLEALRLATVEGHRLSWSEARRGALRPGHDADFVVLPVDPLTGDWDSLATAQADLTVVDGRAVHESAAIRGASTTSRELHGLG
jgi:predicted amidohydrolase YtcJ